MQIESFNQLLNKKNKIKLNNRKANNQKTFKMKKSQQSFVSRSSYREVTDSNNSFRQSYPKTIVNGSNQQIRSQSEPKTQSDRLNDIITQTFQILDTENRRLECQQQGYQDEYQKSVYSPNYSSKPYSDLNSINFLRNKFHQGSNEVESIIHQSNKSSFQKVRQSNDSERFPEKVKRSSDSVQSNTLRSSDQQNHYYNFTLKDSNLNSLYLFRKPQYEQNVNGSYLNGSGKDPTYEQSHEPWKVNGQFYASNKKYQKRDLFDEDSSRHQRTYKDIQRSHKVGFIKQNKLSSRKVSNPSQNFELIDQVKDSTKLLQDPFQNNQFSSHISQQQEYHVHSHRPKKSSLIHKEQDSEDRILDEEFWLKVAANDELKHTVDTSGTNYHQTVNSASNNNSFKTKDRTNYSEFEKDKNCDYSIYSSQRSERKKQYESDLFDFIKKELIAITIENKGVVEKQGQAEKQFNALKQKNLTLYHLYNKSKSEVRPLIEKEKHSIDTLRKEIQLLEEQVIFYKQHSNTIEQSISQKVKKQEDFYFRHKSNLQQIIMSNNDKIAQLTNDLFELENNFKKERNNLNKSSSNTQMNSHHKKSTKQAIIRNQRLKAQLKQEQQIYKTTVTKYIESQSAIHDLQIQKQTEIRQLFKDLQKAKSLFLSSKSKS